VPDELLNRKRIHKIMAQTTSRILKSNDVEVEGRLQLDFGHPAASAKNIRNTAGGAALVRMLENQNEYAVMEVTCPCGRKTIIRCDYGNATSVKNATPRTETPTVNKKP
jgi:hypothetical protein